MAKTCQVENCVSPVFSHGFCQRHGYLRTDKKPKKIPTYTKKGRLQTFDFGFDDQTTMFGTLWENHKDEKGRVLCTFTGQQLNGFLLSDLYWNCFAHILSKKQYPWFKLNPANICIVAPEFHRIVDAGTQKERAEHPTWRFDLWDARVIAMKEEYQKFKKQNLLA
jgi:hypothetical protein